MRSAVLGQEYLQGTGGACLQQNSERVDSVHLAIAIHSCLSHFVGTQEALMYMLTSGPCM